jgi:hypothetical protein
LFAHIGVQPTPHAAEAERHNNSAGAINVINSTIRDNYTIQSDFGGGIFNNMGTLNVTNCLLSGNASGGNGGRGGGIANLNAQGTVTK